MELMAKGGMRIGEVLKIRPIDVKDRKITLPDPKSGLETEIVYIPQKIADRLREYIQDKGIGPEKRIFPITYNAARIMVKKAGESAGVTACCHSCIQIRNSNRNCQQGHPAACSFSDNSAIFGKGDRRRSHEMD
jgi:integrase